MSKINKINISYDQLRELVLQLEFKKKMNLINDIIREKEYKKDFYSYTESLLVKYNIPNMNEDELDDFLH